MSDFINSWKPIFKLEYEGKSRSELVNIKLQAIHDANILPADALVEKGKQLAIAEVCNELIHAIDKRIADIEKAHEQFGKDIVKMRHENILNLKTAASLNGQLVAAVLEEEDGLNAEEIASWFEELDVLEEDEFTELLNGLCDQGIIDQDDNGKYHLLYALNEDMEAIPQTEYVRNKLEFEKISEKDRFILDVLYYCGEKAPEDFNENEMRLYRIILDEKKYSESVWEISPRDVEYNLRLLNLKKNLAERYYSNGVNLYYCPLLGKKEDNK